MRRSYAGHGVNFVNFAVIGKLYIGEFGNELALILDMRGRVGVGVDDTGVGHGEFMDGIFAWESVRYNENYVIGMIIGFVGGAMAIVFLLTDMIFCRFDSTEANGHYITAYRGMTKNIVYVNGEEKDRVGMFSITYVLETKLPDGVKISVTFARGAFLLAHITFSDNNPSVDL